MTMMPSESPSESTNGDDYEITPFFTRDGEHLLYLAKCATIIPRITGTMSFFGSVMMIYVLICDRKMLSKVKNRILFGMGCMDCLSSFALAISTAAIPKGTPGVWHAEGNTATCDAQGFFAQLGHAVPYYNCALSLYYLLVVRHNIKDKVISKRVEPFMHGFSILFPLVTAIISVKLGLFNAFGSYCWVQAHPYKCASEKYECTRGSTAEKYRWIFAGIPLLIAFSFIILFMTMLIHSIYNVEKKLKAHNFVGENDAMHKIKIPKHEHRRTREAFNQALLFIGAYLITYCFTYAVTILLMNGHTPPPFLSILLFIFFPMQGFWNFLIFMRPRYILIGKAHPEKSVWMKCYQSMKVLNRNDLRRLSRLHSIDSRRHSSKTVRHSSKAARHSSKTARHSSKINELFN